MTRKDPNERSLQHEHQDDIGAGTHQDEHVDENGRMALQTGEHEEDSQKDLGEDDVGDEHVRHTGPRVCEYPFAIPGSEDTQETES